MTRRNVPSKRRCCWDRRTLRRQWLEWLRWQKQENRATGKPDLASDYFGGDAKGEYCKLDNELVALPGTSQAATSDLRDIVFPEDHYRLTREYLIRPKTEWPSQAELKKTRTHLGVKKGHYSDIVNKLSSTGMVVFLEPGEKVFENSLFGVWKEVGTSQRLIWGGNRSNLLFNQVASYVELPTPDMF